jgi:MFS family permease
LKDQQVMDAFGTNFRAERTRRLDVVAFRSSCSTDIAPVALRGISTAGINLGIALGQLLSNAVVKGFGEWTSRWAYAAPFAVQMFFVAFLAAGFYFVPESPWFLVRKGKDEQALKALQTLWGKDMNVSE